MNIPFVEHLYHHSKIMSNDEDINEVTNPLLSASEEEEHSVGRNSVKNSQRSSLFTFIDTDSGCQEDEIDLINPLLSATGDEVHSVERNRVNNAVRRSLFAFNDMDSFWQDENFTIFLKRFSDDSVEEMTYARRIALTLMNFSKCFLS